MNVWSVLPASNYDLFRCHHAISHFTARFDPSAIETFLAPSPRVNFQKRSRFVPEIMFPGPMLLLFGPLPPPFLESKTLFFLYTYNMIPARGQFYV